MFIHFKRKYARLHAHVESIGYPLPPSPDRDGPSMPYEHEAIVVATGSRCIQFAPAK